MKQRILVLGASGFIGKRIVAALALTDWAQPVAASRSVSKTISNPLVEKIALDATDEVAMTRALADVAAVVNCVAGDPTTIVASAKLLFTLAGRMAAAPRIVHMSSLAAYGSTVGVVDESAPLLGDLDAYSAAKAATERLAASCANVVVLRPGIVYGPESPWWTDRIGRLLQARRLGNLGALGKGRCNLVYVDDVVAAALEAVRRPGVESHAFNLSCPNPPTWNEYFSLYAQALGATPVNNLPRWRIAYELKVLAIPLKFVEIAANKLKRPHLHPAPPLRPWLITLCQHDIAMQVGKAEAMLGLRWLPLQQGLQQSANWFLAGGRTWQ